MALKASTQERLGVHRPGRLEVLERNQRGFCWTSGAEDGRGSGLEDTEVLCVLSMGKNWRVWGVPGTKRWSSPQVAADPGSPRGCQR